MMDAQVNWQDRVKAGMTVNGAEGLAVAHVIRPGPIDFLVESPSPEAHSLYIPFTAIQRITDGEITLAVPSDQLYRQGWFEVEEPGVFA
ncbi:hypothetical protein [Nitrolancea hollandica]|nr:hypothetical protein [Nitrolancea hollandica]